MTAIKKLKTGSILLFVVPLITTLPVLPNQPSPSALNPPANYAKNEPNFPLNPLSASPNQLNQGNQSKPPNSANLELLRTLIDFRKKQQQQESGLANVLASPDGGICSAITDTSIPSTSSSGSPGGVASNVAGDIAGITTTLGLTSLANIIGWIVGIIVREGVLRLSGS